VCGKTYWTADALRSHVYHTSNRACRDGAEGQRSPQPGAAAEVRSSQGKLLGKRVDDGSYRCAVCGKTYGTPDALRKHVSHRANAACREGIDGSPMTL
jgi:hypothetical protein